jgi:hypothetical protein
MDKATIFEVSENIPEITIIDRAGPPPTYEDIRLEHVNRGDSRGGFGHDGTMDDVNRATWPDPQELDVVILGNQDIPTSVDAGVRPELSPAAGMAPNATVGSRRQGLDSSLTVDKSRPAREPGGQNEGPYKSGHGQWATSLPGTDGTDDTLTGFGRMQKDGRRGR